MTFEELISLHKKKLHRRFVRVAIRSSFRVARFKARKLKAL